MAKSFLMFCLMLTCLLLLGASLTNAAPKPQQQKTGVAPAEAEDLESGAEADGEKDDLQGSSSFGYGYYSSPYLGGYYGGYYPYYGGYYGGWGGYPYYGGYYGGLYGHGLHGHYF